MRNKLFDQTLLRATAWGRADLSSRQRELLFGLEQQASLRPLTPVQEAMLERLAAAPLRRPRRAR
jgi:hypothetical protein